VASPLDPHPTIGTPPSDPGKGQGQCSTGNQHCCNSVQKAGDARSTGLLGSLGLNLDPNVLIGTNCSPLSGVGISSNSWCVYSWHHSFHIIVDFFHCVHSSQQPVCCNDNHFNGLVVVGCTPSTYSIRSSSVTESLLTILLQSTSACDRTLYLDIRST